MKLIVCRSKKFGDHFAKIDDCDFEMISKYKWLTVRSFGCSYASTSKKIFFNGKLRHVRMHRIILNCSDGEIVDHKDGDGLNNQRQNIRKCTCLENSRNKDNRKKKSRISFKGVGWHKATKKFRAYINISYRHLSLGYYENEYDAARAYNEAAIKYFGEFAKLNDVPIWK